MLGNRVLFVVFSFVSRVLNGKGEKNKKNKENSLCRLGRAPLPTAVSRAPCTYIHMYVYMDL